MFTQVLFISGIGGDTQRYRCHHQQEQLALHGITSTLREATDRQLYGDITTHDLVILHRVGFSELISDVIELARQRNLPLVFETDDLIFEPELYGSIAFLDTLSPADAQRFRASLHAQAQTFAACDYVLTTTQYLADAAAKHGKRTFIQRNACSAEMLRTAEAAYSLRQRRNSTPQIQHVNESPLSARERGSGGEVIIGYFSGTGSHNRDFAMITPALLTVLERYPQVWLHVSGHLALDQRFQPYQARIRRAPFVPWQELPHLVAQVDINLAPLELDNPFCQSKSEIKYSEAALVGVPTVASPTEAFVYAIQPEETGVLAATTEEWVAALSRLIEDPAARQRLGENARRQVYQDYSPAARSRELLATLEQIAAQARGAISPACPVATNLARMMQRQIDELLAQQRQDQRQLEQLRQTIAAWQPQAESSQTEFWRQSFGQIEQQHLDALQGILARLQNNK